MKASCFLESLIKKFESVFSLETSHKNPLRFSSNPRKKVRYKDLPKLCGKFGVEISVQIAVKTTTGNSALG
jgi:hypothetical protein